MKHNLNIGTKREFLNEDYITSLTAMIGYSIKVSSYKDELVEEGLYDNSEIHFAITSCHRKLELDFDISNKNEMRNSIYKLDTIILVCEAMKEDLKKASLLVNQGIKRIEELDNMKSKTIQQE